jgi:hypothetical protein
MSFGGIEGLLKGKSWVISHSKSKAEGMGIGVVKDGFAYYGAEGRLGVNLARLSGDFSS